MDVTNQPPIDDGPEAQAARRRALEQALTGIRAARRRRKPEPSAVPVQPPPEPSETAEPVAESGAEPGAFGDAWPAVSTLPWIEQAACQEADPTLFFGPDLLSTDGRRERIAERRRRETEAKVFCSDCPVRAQCAEHALSLPEAHGVWGGMGEMERLALLRRAAV
ncbi:WhiB family transcriptional regulator [Catenulispora rubra]|uniref:WhiB family transcriptional regulator n=1 Tax=Catenulispora rubra TaxID=280293 RepID=UPI002B2720B3|nr:WhiB family transcriptional regulator [Catenulispora rubra]